MAMYTFLQLDKEIVGYTEGFRRQKVVINCGSIVFGHKEVVKEAGISATKSEPRPCRDHLSSDAETAATPAVEISTSSHTEELPYLVLGR
ncbi:hypothetical protein VI817_008287 [Penicillium citrinum]|uniref:Uncharacterized protein n=1 Tax=Penicillium hetheringtonii TaxID=911720 RepID=A0AAD6DJZ7_9EURO|nr:hypothetical protein N7450_006268 [Penicillium hetheringtonii]KAK5789163.1 hypothetical protein VI817_008287 [Penicillium citrinum]